MSAVNSLQPPSSPGGEQRPYEPSMEEILASIRRIIADDQPLPPVREPEARGPTSIPESESTPTGEVAVAPDEPEPIVRAPVETSSLSGSTVHVLSGPVAPPPHGHIAAPQFPTMPEGTVAPVRSDEPDVPKIAGLGSAEPAESVIPSASTVHDRAREHVQVHVQEHVQPHTHEDSYEPRDDEATYHAPDASHAAAAAHHPSPDAEGLFSEATDHSVTAAFNALAASRLADNSEELLGIARDMIRPLLKAWIDDNLPSMVERMVRAEIERVARGGRQIY